MTRAACTHVLLSLLAASCAQRSTPPTGAPRVHACTSVSEPGVSIPVQRDLERASNALEYENVWRASRPGAATGTVNGAEVQATIRAHIEEVQKCYEAALHDSSESGGRVVVRFVIDATGRVPQVNLGSSELDASELGCCVVERVSQWSFPKPENGSFVVVEYPFVVHLAR
ncbi:MAG TPA: AgmX/PglI C-terminal domain-containing protein [Polyangiales bacterium]|nr:AgmX/PglI C-terminal domain-containing protein [Polyangiales bacterium]